MKTDIYSQIKTLVVVTVIGVGVMVVSPVFGWNPPTTTPTGNNALPPLLSDSSPQAKGGAGMGSFLYDVQGLLLSNDLVVAGTSVFGGKFTNTLIGDSSRTTPVPVCVASSGNLVICP